MTSAKSKDEEVTYRSLGWIVSGLGIGASTVCRLLAMNMIRVQLNVDALPTYCVEDIVARMKEQGIETNPPRPFGKPWLAKLRAPGVPIEPARQPTTAA